jgi:hypothetical protein
VIMQALTAIAAALMIAVRLRLLVRPVLQRLPEPAGGHDKPLYRDLPTIRFYSFALYWRGSRRRSAGSACLTTSSRCGWYLRLWGYCSRQSMHVLAGSR